MDTSVRYILLFLPLIFSRNVFTFPLILIWLLFLSYFFRFGDGCSKKPRSFLYQFSVNRRRKSGYRITLQNTCLGHIWQIHRGVLHWKNRKFLCVSWFHGSDAVADWVGITRKSFLLQEMISPTSKQALLGIFLVCLQEKRLQENPSTKAEVLIQWNIKKPPQHNAKVEHNSEKTEIWKSLSRISELCVMAQVSYILI